MEKNISKQIKDLVADNRLEYALDMLIGIEESKGRDRYNTLILLKGKLQMLEEQELADLLEFSDLEREKRKIAYALLNMTDDDETAPLEALEPSPLKQVEVRKTVTGPEKSPVGFAKYFLPLAVVVGIALGIFWMTNRSSPSGNDDQGKQELPEENKVQDNTIPPNTNSGQLKLIDFPNINRPFNFSDIKYHIKDVQVERFSSAGIKLTLKMDLTCGNNLGTCNREEARIVVDGNLVEPKERRALESYMENNTSTKEELVFIFQAGKNYKFLLEKNGSTWERGFKIL